MPRTNQDGKDIRTVLEWLCRKHLSKDDLALALGVSTSTYDRRSGADDFPSYEELETFATHYGLHARALQVAFGYLDLDRILLDESELRQYVEQGGGETPSFPTLGGTRIKAEPRIVHRPRRERRADAPPGP